MVLRQFPEKCQQFTHTEKGLYLKKLQLIRKSESISGHTRRRKYPKTRRLLLTTTNSTFSTDF